MRIVFIILFFSMSIASARVLSVPGEYATIQAAFDALQDEDTIQVAAGTYAEALSAPPLSFLIRGDAPSDSNDPPAIIDPSSLPGSDSLTCLFLPEGSHPVVEYLTFRNREAMYPRVVPGRSAGIIPNASSPVLIRSCVFDSVYIAVRPWAADSPVDLRLESCRFMDCQDGCVSPGVGGLLLAEDCTFGGHLSVGGSSLVHGSHAPIIRHCRFLGEPGWGYLHCLRDSATIEECTFGPAEGVGYEAVVFYSRGVNRISNCEVFDLPSSCNAITISPRADEMDPEWPPTYLSGNVFMSDVEDSSIHTRGIYIDRAWDEPNRGFAASLDDNTFVRSGPSAGSPWIPAVYGNAPVEMYRNRFMNLNGSQWAIFEPDSGALPSLLRDNLFCSSDWAVRAPIYANSSVDARWNWWGDITGPHHPFLNPDGLGQEVSFWVEFEPWRTDTNLNVNHSHFHEPFDFEFAIAPNPFNAQVTIEFAMTRALPVRVEIFDLLGRHVTTLADDVRDLGIHRVTWNASDQASGIYFARLSSPISSNAAQVKKLVLLK